MKELARITREDIIKYPMFDSLHGFLIGKNVVNNPNAIRVDDLITRDIIFYKQHSKDGGK